MRVTVRADVAGTRQDLRATEKQLRFATARALTRTAQDIRAAEYEAMPRVFDRPARYTLNSLFLSPARREKLEARVWVKDKSGKGTAAMNYLGPQIYGGSRNQKRFEKALESAGIMPKGWFAVPRGGARLDAYGNMSRGQIVQLLSALRAFAQVGYLANVTERSRARNRKSRDYFVSGPVQAAKAANGGRLPFGVYERKGRGIKTVLLFVPRVTYRVRFPFFRIGETTYSRTWERNMRESLDNALATARPSLSAAA